MLRLVTALLTALSLAACSPSGADLSEPLPDLGDFRLCHNVVVAPKVGSSPLSREYTEEEITLALKQAIGARLGRHQGSRLYHLGVSIEALDLARAGVPVLASPKTIMRVRVTVWDNATQSKLTDPPVDFTVFESASGATVLGSGLTQSRETQLRNVSQNAALQIESFLAEKRRDDGWFGSGPGPEPEGLEACSQGA